MRSRSAIDVHDGVCFVTLLLMPRPPIEFIDFYNALERASINNRSHEVVFPATISTFRGTAPRLYGGATALFESPERIGHFRTVSG